MEFAGQTGLDERGIVAAIGPAARPHIRRVTVVAETDSTNDELLRLPADEVHGCVLLAEHQTAGRGRRGRRWLSPPGNIWLSLGWRFDAPSSSLGALGLVAGVCLCRALARIGLRGHGIKWPNDVQVAGAKLGGILVESRGGAAVIGIGINVDLGDQADGIGRPVTDLARQAGLGMPERNAIVAAILDSLIEGLSEGGRGFAPFLDDEWRRWDVLHGHRVRVERGGEVLEGRAEGISADGCLRVRLLNAGDTGREGRVVIFHSGEVSVRGA